MIFPSRITTCFPEWRCHALEQSVIVVRYLKISRAACCAKHAACCILAAIEESYISIESCRFYWDDWACGLLRQNSEGAPERRSRRAAVSPVMPAPTITTSASMLSTSFGKFAVFCRLPHIVSVRELCTIDCNVREYFWSGRLEFTVAVAKGRMIRASDFFSVLHVAEGRDLRGKASSCRTKRHVLFKAHPVIEVNPVIIKGSVLLHLNERQGVAGSKGSHHQVHTSDMTRTLSDM